MREKFMKLPLWTKMIIEISLNEGEYSNLWKLTKKINCTYSHTTELNNMFKKKGIIKDKKKGRIKITTLTIKGKELGKRLVEMNDILVKEKWLDEVKDEEHY